MFCVQCMTPADSLFIEYSHGHIKLTDCPNCNQTVDKYVEYDNVLIFIDLLLLKPECYRHMVYNSLENMNNNTIEEDSRSLLNLSFVHKLWTLLIAFEIYLTWASAEQTQFQKTIELPMTLTHFVLLTRGPVRQYLFFTVQFLVDIFLLESISYLFFKKLIHNTNVKSSKVISNTILLAHGARLFPILMLIWPYDSSLSVETVQWIASIYVIEALRIVLDMSWLKIVPLYFNIILLKWCITKMSLALFVTGFNWPLVKTFLANELRYVYIVLQYNTL